MSAGAAPVCPGARPWSTPRVRVPVYPAVTEPVTVIRPAAAPPSPWMPSCASVVRGTVLAEYGETAATAWVTDSATRSWPVCSSSPPVNEPSGVRVTSVCTLTCRCTHRPRYRLGYRPGWTVPTRATPSAPVRTPPRRKVPLSGSVWPLLPAKPEYSPSASQCPSSTSAPAGGAQVASSTTASTGFSGTPGLPSVRPARTSAPSRWYGPSGSSLVSVHTAAAATGAVRGVRAPSAVAPSAVRGLGGDGFLGGHGADGERAGRRAGTERDGTAPEAGVGVVCHEHGTLGRPPGRTL